MSSQAEINFQKAVSIWEDLDNDLDDCIFDDLIFEVGEDIPQYCVDCEQFISLPFLHFSHVHGESNSDPKVGATFTEGRVELPREESLRVEQVQPPQTE